mgnify:CR=1 FL=1
MPSPASDSAPETALGLLREIVWQARAKDQGEIDTPGTVAHELYIRSCAALVADDEAACRDALAAVVAAQKKRDQERATDPLYAAAYRRPAAERWSPAAYVLWTRALRLLGETEEDTTP